MSNSGAHEMAQAQARMAGRFTGLPETGVVGPHPGAHPGAHAAPPARDLDPAVAGLVARLPGPGGTMSRGAIDRWTDAARAVLTLAYADEEDPPR
ncbi:hypothetical protein [Actinomadura rupiterrae]|uniref:hypothetical protein n=1 Tax=Actinomadura rupiterrae TaxID=559627 RepID=UPI0020A28D83|nr:hypothetical protein [Actinomadura rupiterrae]MCP2336282.1 hypothetical protein [Actinomadura rupiterrae]